jgi:hypothetical protein
MSRSGSQISPLRELSALRLTVGEPPPLEMANTRGKRLSPACAPPVALAQNYAPGTSEVNFLNLSMEGHTFG